MNPITTPSEFHTAFDTLLAGTHRQLRVYDHNLEFFDIDHTPRLAALRTLCVAGGARRVELLLDDTSRVARDHPRLMLLLRDFGHVLEIREADLQAPRPDQAFVIADRTALLLRPDKAAIHAILHENDPARAAALDHGFEEMWQRAPVQVSATTLGL